MNVIWTELDVAGCYSGNLSVFSDNRGTFQKLFNTDGFQSVLPGFLPRECYLTTSASGVLRGMHFQLPPDSHAKVVICLSGKALDVMVDLRGGPEFGKTAQVQLTPEGNNCVVMPKGIGHGFYAHADNTCLLYLVETGYAQASDSGVSWDSIGVDWPSPAPIISERDNQHPLLSNFTIPKSWHNGEN